MLRVFLGFVVIILIGLHFTISHLNEQKKEVEKPMQNHESTISKIDEDSQKLDDKDNVWLLLKKTSHQQIDSVTFRPDFPREVIDLDNKEVLVQGFMYPLSEDEKQKHFILSYYPLQSCFFCGMAGPETIMEVYMKKGITIDKNLVTLKGKLTLNSENPDHPFFILKEASRHQIESIH